MLLGEKIAESGGKVGVPVHASVSGVVKDFTTTTMPNGTKSLTVVLENDGKDTPAPPLRRPQREPEEIAPEEIVDFMEEAGLVGMGGAAFPTHVKYRLPEGTKIDTLIVNGAECEPFLTCDHRLMLEDTDDLILGIRLMMRASGATRAIVGIEENKPDAIALLEERFAGLPQVEVKKVKLKYPQGEERLLIKPQLAEKLHLTSCLQRQG